MSLRDMPVVTVEQIVRFREKAMEVEQQREKLLEALTEYIAAADYSVQGIDDVAAMLRYGHADMVARELIAEIEAAK